MRPQWDAPANQWHHTLPKRRTLRQQAEWLRGNGLTFPQIVASMRLTCSAESVSSALKRGPSKRSQAGKHPLQRDGLTPHLWRRLAREYGVTVTELRELRRRGMTVAQYKEAA